MKNFLLKSFTFLAMVLFLSACQDQFEIVETEGPTTEVLDDTNISGNVLDIDALSVSDLIVDLLLDGDIIASTIVTDGQFEFLNQAVSNNSILKIHGNGYTPNYSKLTIEANQVSTVDFVVERFSGIRLVSDGDTSVHPCEEELLIQLSSNDIEQEPNSFVIHSQFYNFLSDSEELIPSIGDEQELVRNAIYIAASSETGEEFELKEGSSFEIGFRSDVQFKGILFFDETQGRWVDGPDAIMSQPSSSEPVYTFTATKFGMYKVGSLCESDMSSPIPICLVEFVRSMGTANVFTVNASQFDAGFYDDCDDLITLEIRRMDDPCNLDADQWASGIQVCDDEIGTSFDVYVKGTDDARNSDFCICTLTVTN